MAGPLEQFAIKTIQPLQLGPLDVSITNHTVWLFAAVAVVSLIFVLGSYRRAAVPGRLQAFVEIIYEFIADLTTNTAGPKAAKFAPLIFTLFLFIAGANLIGMVPKSYTATSQIITTALLAVTVFGIVIVTGFANHGLKFLKIFFPSGTPLYMAPLIIPLEIISFFVRPCTLAIRLAANMIAGHILLKVFASFVVMLGGLFAAASIVPLVALVMFTGLEVFVALLQAFIFTVLTCVYLSDALELH